MATDYNKIGENPRINFRKIFTPYSDKTHFVYELIQNADDNESECIELQLYENELIVWNDGDEFLEEDVRSICSIGFSNKDLTQIGTFGMGFKAVYTYTDSPEVYSGDERFRLSINNPTKPEGIDGDIDERILEQLKESKRLERKRTIFRLPFREKLRQDEEIALLKDRLCNLEVHSLLFLRNLRRVQWYDANNGQKGSYSCQRRLHEKIQNAPEVELRASMNDFDQPSETFLVFRKEVQPPQKVIDELLQQSEDEDERYRIQRSAKKLQPVEVAFKFQDGRITVMNNCVLFSYFPTEKETHLRFFIQASYKTTLARENIEKNNQWNRWLVRETAKFLPEILEQLKASDLLEPEFFNVLPLKDEVENEFKPIAEALQKAMRERAFVPTQGGEYAKAENVFYPHHGFLRKFVECSWIYPNSSWLHPDIGRSGRAFRVMHEARVKEINVSQVLNWLEKRDCNWFEARSNEWLRSLYDYLNDQKSQLERINGLERIKKLPLVRLENGRHVCGSDAFFSPDTDEAREEIAPFLDELPILQSTLLQGEKGHDIKSFLEKLGVRGLDPQEMIGKWILPQYSRCDKPSKEQNRLHVRYIFKVWDKYEHRQLKAELCRTPILRAYNNGQPETYEFVKPYDAYLPEAYTGDTHLETYFSVSDNDVWFVDSGYLDDNSNSKEWLQFLKSMGTMDTPRVDKIEVVGSKEACKKRKITRELSTRRFEDGEFKSVHRKSNQYFCGYIVDPCWVGWSQILTQIKKRNGVNLSCSVWNLLIKAIKAIKPRSIRISIESARYEFFQGTYHWYYNTNRDEKFNSLFYRDLIDTDWLPDEQGEFHKPSELFAPTDENRELLGHSMPYLHPDFDVTQDNETAQWLAKKLKIALKPKIENVMNSLRTLSGTEVSVKQVEPLYRFLNQQSYRRFTSITDGGWTEEFKRKPLIFTPNPESRWWRVDEVFWEDKSEVLENDRRCLKAHYPAILKSFFINLGVSEQASQRDYACRIQEIATIEQAADKKVRERLRRLYKCFMTWQKNEWEIIYDDKCWLGKKGNEWEFFSRNQLVRNDHPYIVDIFEGGVPFWTFDDLLELTRYLEIEGCSQAKVEFHPEGDQEEDIDLSIKVRNLRPYIHAFLNSPRLCEAPAEIKSADVLNLLSVRFVEELKTTYTLKEIPRISPNPRPSSLEVTNEEVTLWLALAADKDDYASLIGDALQDYFGIKDLGRFTEHLLTKTIDTVLNRWKLDGLRTDLCPSLPKLDSKEGDKNTAKLVDKKLPDGTNSEDDSGTNDSEVETPTIYEDPEDGNENDNSTENESEIATYQPRPGGNGTRQRSGKAINTPNKSRDTGHSSGHSSGKEDDTHMGATDTSPQAKKEIEHAGMKYACRYEKEEGRTPKDVSSEKRGYDLRSTTQDGKNRYIEVKARANRDSVVLTSKEWSVAKQIKDNYFLYIVLNAKTRPELYIIRDPADAVSPVPYVTMYQVPLSEITEHGIRV